MVLKPNEVPLLNKQQLNEVRDIEAMLDSHLKDGYVQVCFQPGHYPDKVVQQMICERYKAAGWLDVRFHATDDERDGPSYWVDFIRPKS